MLSVSPLIKMLWENNTSEQLKNVAFLQGDYSNAFDRLNNFGSFKKKLGLPESRFRIPQESTLYEKQHNRVFKMNVC